MSARSRRTLPFNRPLACTSHPQAEGHGRVEMAATDMADGEGHGHHGQAKCQRDPQQADADLQLLKVLLGKPFELR